jgi:hypothetical protein
MGLTIDQIKKVVNNFVVQTKEFDAERAKRKYDPILQRVKYPEYWEGYEFAVKMYEAILPHVRPDAYPHHLFSVRAPNQTVEQEQYIKANYKPTTLNVFEDFRSTISRCFADPNWSLTVNAEKDERFQNETFSRYINSGILKFGSIEMFVKNMLPSLMLMDANGIIAIKPLTLDYQTDDDGELITDDNGQPILSNNLVEPIPVYYSSKDIVGQRFGEYYLVKTEIKSIVSEGGKNKREGLVLEFYDNFGIYRIEQIGKKNELTFGEPYLFFEHGLDYVPCEKLGGSVLLEDNSIVFQSPFITAVPLLDLVLLDESYLQMSKAMCAFPFMVAIGDICTFTSKEGQICNEGEIWSDSLERNITCPSCNGAGVKSRFSPTGKLLIKPKTSLNDGDTGINGEYLKFVSPPMDTLKFLRDEITQHTSRSREVLHLSSADQAATVGEAKTATGSLNKLRALHAFLKPISDMLFSRWEFILTTTGKMRYGEYFGGFELIYPSQFEISSPSDYLAIIGEGISVGVPPSVTYANVYNYIKSINYTDSESTKVFELIMDADELLLMPESSIIALVANGTYEKWQVVVHNSAPQLIKQLMRSHVATEQFPTFLDLPMDEKIAALKQAAIETIGNVDDPITQAQMTLLANA